MSERIEKFYDSDAESYNERFYEQVTPYPTLRYRHEYVLGMLDAASVPKDAFILDAGCGPGELVADLARRGNTVYGIDISSAMIAIAKKKTGTQEIPPKVHLATGDTEQLAFPSGMFDVVILSGVVEYLPDDTKWIAEVSRVLKPHGILIVNVTNRYAVRRWTMGPLNRLKSSAPVRRLLDAFKKRVLHAGEIQYFPFRPRVHSPGQFDRFLGHHGYDKTGHRYFDFCLFPYPIDTIFGFALTPLRRRMESWSQKNMVLFGTGYLVSARKRH